MTHFLQNHFKKAVKQLLFFLVILFFTMPLTAQETTGKTTSSMSNPGIIMSVVVIVSLALVILVLGNAVIGAKTIYRERTKKEAEQTGSSLLKTIVFMVGFSLCNMQQATAQLREEVSETASAFPATIGGLPASLFYIIMSIILLELIVILVLVNILKFLTGIQRTSLLKEKPVAVTGTSTALTNWWNKLNQSVAIEKEKDIDLSHDYDGIRELDNAVPPWWKWTFIASIIFGAVYLWRYHIAETAPLQIQELQIAMQRAEIEKEEFLKTSASKVDETTVKLLDENGIAAGKILFTTNCVACHGANGEGNAVGPNLTDQYWIHKGSIHDIFKTIKYGWVEKGMKAWKDDFTPVQIAQLSSYIKSISGTNAPNGKAAQGELYTEGPAGKDSAKNQPAADTTAN
jgi:cytochrome c oxidase cbb3-type subunit III